MFKFDDGIVDQKDIDELIGRLERACKDAADNSNVFRTGSKEYTESHRYYVDSSSFPSHAVVRPGSAKAISKILTVVEDLRVPFSIKGGGHAMAPFHPPPQIIQTAPVMLKPWFLIDMSRFDQLIYNEGDQTVTVGAGCLWKDVNVALEAKYKRGVVGGSNFSAAGVAGFLMGGGYSFPKTNQFGLGIDNVKGYEVVLPCGEIKTVRPTDSDSADVDLFHALRGGGANFGIVTNFILKTHYQAAQSLKFQKVDFPGSKAELAKKVIIHWIEHEHRPQAAMLAYFRYDLAADKSVLEFKIACTFALNSNNDTSEALRPPGQNPQDGEQDSQDHEFYKALSITEADVLLSSAYTSKSALAVLAAIEEHRHLESVQGQTVDVHSHVYTALGCLTEPKTRGRFGCIMVKNYTPKLIDEIHKQADEASRFLRDHSGIACFIKVWPFLSSIFDDSPEGAAWPHKKGEVYGPCWAYFQWTDETEDRFWLEKMKSTLDALRKVAESEGVTSDDAPVYLNTTLEDTPVEKIYQNNLEHLKLMRERYDPKGIMSLTGGFKIPLPSTA